MKLKDFLEKTNMSAAELARRLGVSRSTITHLANGDKVPSLMLAFKISNLTNRKVSIESWCVDQHTTSA